MSESRAPLIATLSDPATHPATDPATEPASAALLALWPADDPRAQAFRTWLQPLVAPHRLDPATLRPASADASFRRYFRIDRRDRPGSFIIMDAPPPQEDVRPFLDIAGRLQTAGLHGPAMLEADAAQGFILMGDLGGDLYLATLKAAREADDVPRVQHLMRDALAALRIWQRRVRTEGLPAYDDAMLRRELELFPTWCVEREYGRTWTEAQRSTWQQVSDRLIASALAQPRVAVHRDWMPRNLMVTEPNPGILDFQDAAHGPVTYDIASWLRDAFISWDEADEIDWAVRWWQGARDDGLLTGHPMAEDFGEAWRAIEWMGLQRHLKVLGIFCRLKHRDGKAHYASDLPRFFGYAARVVTRYTELKALLPLLEDLAGPLTTEGFSLR